MDPLLIPETKAENMKPSSIRYEDSGQKGRGLWRQKMGGARGLWRDAVDTGGVVHIADTLYNFVRLFCPHQHGSQSLD